GDGDDVDDDDDDGDDVDDDDGDDVDVDSDSDSDNNNGGLRVGRFGILEPSGSTPVAASQIDVMIVPGVAFTRDGRRLGRGRGYYDRYLARPDFRATTMGVGFSHQLLRELPTEPHDRTLDRIVIPFAASPVPDIMRRIVSSAWGDADRLGCGVERLISMGYTWVLLKFKMSLVRTPEADEPLQIETWISSCSRVVTHRNFVVRDNSGKLLGEAITEWCMIDLESRRPVDLTRTEINYTQYITPRNGTIELTRKLPIIEPDSSECSAKIESYIHQATEDDIDFNRHVNTFKYVEMMLSMLPHSTLAERGAVEVDMQFVHESYLGEQLTIRHKRECETAAPHSLFDILRPDGSTAVKALFRLLPHL
ncbi:MAG: 5-formyltetrahydrofolate cyclo-ligase, partial [Rikenellaceae bacterium]